MIRYPKRNVAQRGPKRPPSLVPSPNRIVRPNPLPKKTGSGQVLSRSENSFNEYAKLDSAMGGEWENVLYPAGLAQLHLDIDRFTYGQIDKNQDRRIPKHIKQLEALADKLLYEFIAEKLNLESPGEYYAQVRKAMGPEALSMFAYRCAIGALDIDGEIIDSLEIYVSEHMGSADFPRTYGEENYEEYDHSKLFVMERKLVSKREQVKKLEDRDKMPDFALKSANDLLASLGQEPVDELRATWRSLSAVSRKSGIEARILSRIAYLIANSIFTRAQNLLEEHGGY